MQWQLMDRGFLPTPDPIVKLPHHEFIVLESFLSNLPVFIANRSVAANGVHVCKCFYNTCNLMDFLETENHAQVERLFMLLSYVASAYVHGDGRQELPDYVARPLVRLAKVLQRPPILSYASYCLHNWKRKDPNQPITLDNLELLQNFSTDAKEDEDWFILVHVDIEYRAHEALAGMVQLQKIAQTANLYDSLEPMERIFEQVVKSMKAMNVTLARMPEHCRPDTYFCKVRPYIFGFTNVTYRGCFDDVPQSFRGETGAQSSIVPALIRALGIRHRDSMLTTHLNDMFKYMPVQHRAFIDSFTPSKLHYMDDVRSFVLGKTFHSHSNSKHLTDLYNDCVQELITFRSKHFEYAVEYVQKRVTDPTGTGGTPYVRWLQQLVEETKEAFIINKERK